MTTIAPVRIAQQALSRLGQPGPINTCVSNGMNRWPQEVGLPGIDTASVTEARALAKAGHNGWRYHEGMDGIRVGYFVDWLRPVGIFHVSCVTDIDTRGNLRTVGSGGPSGLVAYQPTGGGFNPPSQFRGYFIPPTATSGSVVQPPQVQKPTGKKPFVRVATHDNLSKIAAKYHKKYGTTVAGLVRINKIANPDRIVVGQKIYLK